jgi:hypothetical protein
MTARGELVVAIARRYARSRNRPSLASFCLVRDDDGLLLQACECVCCGLPQANGSWRRPGRRVYDDARRSVVVCEGSDRICGKRRQLMPIRVEANGAPRDLRLAQEVRGQPARLELVGRCAGSGGIQEPTRRRAVPSAEARRSGAHGLNELAHPVAKPAPGRQDNGMEERHCGATTGEFRVPMR